MSVLTRTNYIPNTLIESAKANVDFNQLVDLLSGVSTTKDALIKFSNATDPVLRLDQLGAGIIQRWLQNGTEKARVNNDGSFNIGTPGGSPTAGLVGGPDSSGTNTAGAHLDFHGGKGTGNAVPGQVAVRYPLTGASGTTLQSLSANRYPVVASMFTSLAGQTIANTTAETTMLDGGSTGSTKTIEAGMARTGQLYRVTVNIFTLLTTGNPTARIRVKVGSVTVIDTTAVAFPTAALNSNGRLVVDIWVTGIGASGSVTASMLAQYADSTTGQGEAAVRTYLGRGAASGTIDFTAAQAIDVTWQWGTASASNSVQNGPSHIDIVR